MAIIGVQRLSPEDRDWLDRLTSSALAGFRRIDFDRTTLFVPQSSSINTTGGGEIIVGNRFLRDHCKKVERTRENRSSHYHHSIAKIFERWWGDYVAISSDSETIARSPMGSTPCYYVKWNESVIVTTEIRYAFAVTRHQASIDWFQVSRYVAQDQLRTPETCLSGVVELVAGQALVCAAAGISCTSLWSPWAFCEDRSQFTNYDEAAVAIREVIVQCVSAQASQFSNVLLAISGGLDSSVVAAAMHTGATPFSCLTMFTQEKAGDERRYARAVTTSLGVELFECEEAPADVDLDHSDATGLPRPTSRAFSQSNDAAQTRVAAQIGADAFFTGGGGDSVFCYLASVAPVADCLLSRASWPIAVRTARDIASMTGAGIPTILARAVRRAWLRPPDYRWQRNVLLLSDDAKQIALGSHPWLEAPNHALPGKAGHVALILGIQNHLEGYARGLIAPIIHPLLSLPIVETCLRIPTWMWCTGGRNRAIIRDAFIEMLPACVANRRSKGTPGGLVARLYDDRRAQIREMLLDGLLVTNGVVNRCALEKLLGQPASVRNYDYLRAMLLVDVEAWARSWHQSS